VVFQRRFGEVGLVARVGTGAYINQVSDTVGLQSLDKIDDFTSAVANGIYAKVRHRFPYHNGVGTQRQRRTGSNQAFTKVVKS
jgi:hypothetical protein